MRPGVLLDRDGTIIEDYHYVGHVERVQFKPGAIDAIARFNRAGIPVALVTNQSGVARGFYEEANVALVHTHMNSLLYRHGAHIDLWLYSPHHPDGSVQDYRRLSPDHKPGTGMALRAAESLDLDLTRSWVVGDRPDDVIMSYHIGANCAYLGGDLDTWSGDDRSTMRPHPFSSLADAAGYIIERITGMTDSQFPTMNYTSFRSYLTHYGDEVATALRLMPVTALDEAATLLAEAYENADSIFVAGNGAGASLASHFVCDHTKTIGRDFDIPPNVRDMTADISLITAIANDIGYESVFSYQLEQFAQAGDVLVVFSVSGRSPNITRVLQSVIEYGLKSIAITGLDGGEAGKLADVHVEIPARNYGVVEDVMQSVMHALAQYIRQSKMSDEQVRSATF